MNRRAVIIVSAVGATAIVAPTLVKPTPRLLWNASASAPIGLYRVWPGERAEVGDWLLVRSPARFAALFAARRYLPVGVPLVKRVAATGPSLACRFGGRVVVDGDASIWALAIDRAGRPLPVWRGCRRLDEDEIFLLNAASDSLDSRYFGPILKASVIGRLTPLWIMQGASR